MRLKFVDRLVALCGYERRGSLRNPDENMWESLAGGRTTLAGVKMSPATAMSLPGYYAAVRAISEDCAKLPLHHLRRTEDGKDRLRGRLDRILNREPNPEMSSMTWRATALAHAMGFGNHYSEIQRNAGGQLLYLWPLDPSRVRIDRNGAGELIYVISGQTGGQRVLPSRDVFHLHGLGYDGVQGYSIPTIARNTLGLARAQEDSMASLAGKGMRPSGMFSVGEGTMKETTHKSLREQLQEVYGGSGNVGKAIIAEQSMTWHPFPMSMKDSEFIAGCHFSIEQFCRLMRIQPHKIAHLLRATYTNIIEQSMEYVSDTLGGWAGYIEGEITRKLIPSNRPNEFVEHLFDALLRGTPTQRNEAYAIQASHGSLSINEWRRAENRNGIGPAGDKHRVAAGTVAIEDETQQEPEAAAA